MKIKAVKCLGCGDIVYSCARHDFRSCSCGKTSIDGGRDYTKVCFDNKIGFEPVELEVAATHEELYHDWNCNNKRKFGLIKKHE